MNLTKAPIFKSIMFALAVGYVALASQSAWGAKGGKPDPVPQPNHVMWVDANGVILGDAQTNLRTRDANVYFEVDERLYKTELVGDYGIVDFYGGIYYDGPECTGNVYASYKPEIKGGAEVLWSLDKDKIFYTTEADSPRPVYIASEFGQSGGVYDCDPVETVKDVYDAVPVVDTSIYTRPFQLKLIPAN